MATAEPSGPERAPARSIVDWATSLVRPFAVFFLFNVALRVAVLPKLYFLNEDGALILGARDRLSAHGPLSFLWLLIEPYGPSVIRPWQLYGFHLEQGILRLPAPVSITLTLAIFSLALAIFFVSLRRHVGDFGAAVGCFIVSGSPISAEPLLWLSDRHDVYLVFFFACALAVTLSVVAGRTALRRGVVLLSLALWGGFYSNEKGTAVAAIVTLSALALAVAHSPKRPIPRALAIGAAAFANVGFYFLLRRAVLGKWIGGYDDRLLPEGGLTLELARRFARNALALPLFSQTEASPLGTKLLLGALALLLACLVVALARRRKLLPRALLVAALLYAAVVCAAVPTLRNFLEEPTSWAGLSTLGVLNKRMLWLPHIALGIAVGCAFGVAWRHFRSVVPRLALLLPALLLVGNHARYAMLSARPFAKASVLTRQVIETMREHCPCADVTKGQVSVPRHYGGVNAATETIWFDTQFHRLGAPVCREEARRCSVVVATNPTGEAIAWSDGLRGGSNSVSMQ